MWHVDPELNRDIWADDAAHPIDFIHWLLGVPETVTAEIAHLAQSAGAERQRHRHLPLCGRAAGRGGLLLHLRGRREHDEVIGEKGTIIQNYGDVPSCNVPRPAGAIGLKWYTPDKKDWTASDDRQPANHGDAHRRAGRAVVRVPARPAAPHRHGRRGTHLAADGAGLLRLDPRGPPRAAGRSGHRAGVAPPSTLQAPQAIFLHHERKTSPQRHQDSREHEAVGVFVCLACSCHCSERFASACQSKEMACPYPCICGIIRSPEGDNTA